MLPTVQQDFDLIKLRKVNEQANWAYSQGKQQQETAKLATAKVQQLRQESQAVRYEIVKKEAEIRKLETANRYNRRILLQKAAKNETTISELVAKLSGPQFNVALAKSPIKISSQLATLGDCRAQIRDKLTALEESICSMAGTVLVPLALRTLQGAVAKYKSKQDYEEIEHENMVLRARAEILLAQLERMRSLDLTDEPMLQPTRREAAKRELTATWSRQAENNKFKRLCLETQPDQTPTRSTRSPTRTTSHMRRPPLRHCITPLKVQRVSSQGSPYMLN